MSPPGDEDGSPIGWSEGDGIVTLTLDDPLARVNTMTSRFAAAFVQTLSRLTDERARLRGVVLRSAKSTFFAGGDLRSLVQVDPGDRDEFIAGLVLRKARLRQLERLGLPIVAVLEGAALGGGLELALACHRRIATARVQVGFPEINLGLIPGGGGVVRAIHLLGLKKALPILLSGQPMRAAQACSARLVDAVVDASEAESLARRWLLDEPVSRQPWDAVVGAGYAAVDRDAIISLAQSCIRWPGVIDPAAPNPAPRALTELAIRVAGSDFDAAIADETSTFVDVLLGAPAKASLAVLFFDTQRLRAPDRVAARNAQRSGLAVVAPGPRSAAFAGVLKRLPGTRLVSSVDDAHPDELLIWAGHLDGAELSADGRVSGVLEQDAAMAHQLVPIWAAEDAAPAGGVVVELPVGSPDGERLASAFRASGAVVIELADRAGPFGAQVRAAIRERGRQLIAAGIPAGSVAAAASCYGLTLTGDGRPRADADGTDFRRWGEELVVAGCVGALRASSSLRWPEDLDVASVRSGGLPAWTGGAHRFTTKRRSDGNERREQS
jgi:3-hydroxyacyl-CoA dehydrogenase / enoyl-CoA hydratase / 3-hydroxybutyryl-CoA epimerase